MLRRLPHPGRGFTQGLIIQGGTVWESTGQYGESALRRYPLGADGPAASAALPPELFGEGICRAGAQPGAHLWQLTWRERVALRWDPDTLELLGTAAYHREGWGICLAGAEVLTSDGSSELVRRDPADLQPLPGEVIRVRCLGQRVPGLNDLDWSAGRVWANLLGRPYLAGIDPATGEVTDVADIRPVAERHWGDPEAVRNGIASLPGAGEYLLTGKRWRHLYHVRLEPARAPADPARLLTG